MKYRSDVGWWLLPSPPLQQVTGVCFLPYPAFASCEDPPRKPSGLTMRRFPASLEGAPHCASMRQANKFGGLLVTMTSLQLQMQFAPQRNMCGCLGFSHAFSRSIWLHLAAHTANPTTVHVTEISPKSCRFQTRQFPAWSLHSPVASPTRTRTSP